MMINNNEIIISKGLGDVIAEYVGYSWIERLLLPSVRKRRREIVKTLNFILTVEIPAEVFQNVINKEA